MKKLELNLAELRVESFETQDAGRREDGTVHAYITEARYQETCYTCEYAPSCDPSCIRQFCAETDEC